MLFRSVSQSRYLNSPGYIDFLSDHFAASEYTDYAQNSTHTSVNNSYQFDLGPSATSNLPNGLGSTGASYSATVNGFSLNLPNRASYMMSYFGSGNEGMFNNVLVLRKEAFSDTQYGVLSTLTPGSSIILEGATGATQYATVSSVNEETIGSNIRLKIGISHPNKQFEGGTSGGAVVSVTSNNVIVSGTAAAYELGIS